MSELPRRTNEHQPPRDVTDGLGLSEEEEDETPTPDLENPISASNFPPDYSDVPSSGVDENGKQRRRYERGGRKKASPRQQHEQKYSSPKTSSSSRPTGIRSFNVRRAQSGSARPFGVTVEKPQSQAQSQPKERPKTKQKPVRKEPSKKVPVQPIDPDEYEQYPISDEHEQQVDEYEEEDIDEEEEEVRPQEPKEETRRPFAIRLDLNLEIEIFLKAKIKGDVTITFLE